MPQTEVVFYQEKKEDVPVWDWLKNLRGENWKAYAKCKKAIQMLESLGHELRRPQSDILRDGIHELRVHLGHVNYRILYFFDGRTATVLTSG